jgi:dTDP-4-dehydrorhamnose reductase
MIVLLGASGYIGQAFAGELRRRGRDFAPLSREKLDYTRFDLLLEFLRQAKPAFLINAAGFAGQPNVDACESARAETLQGNTLLPATIAHACSAANVPWGHVSSGCIYAGAWLAEAGLRRVEKDLTRPEVQALRVSNQAAIAGFAETDPPNFSFRQPPCSFYSGTKALAEEAVTGLGRNYLWRLRIPFDEFDRPKNYLTKIQRYAKVYDNLNSLSHRGDFARACLDLWERRAPFGIYNVTNPGFVSTRQVAGWIEKTLRPARPIEFFASDEEFYQVAARTPRSNCILDVSKLLAAGVKIRPVDEAVLDSLKNWQPAPA